MSDNDWGTAYFADGTTAPLREPKGMIPEDEREYLYESPTLTLWTRKPEKS